MTKLFVATIKPHKAVTSDLKDLAWRSSWDRSADLDGRVRANSITVFHIICFKERSLVSNVVLPAYSMC